MLFINTSSSRASFRLKRWLSRILLAFIPYFLIRGPVARIARWYLFTITVGEHSMSKLSPSDEMSSRRTGMSFQRTRLSADRTLMSVIRTSLSLIGFRLHHLPVLPEASGKRRAEQLGAGAQLSALHWYFSVSRC